MNKVLFIVFSVLFSGSFYAQNVFYGERNLQEEKLALYFDKDGFPYPDYSIPDSSMKKAAGSLFTWFLQNGEEFIKISAKYDLFPEKIYSETIYALRDSINALNARKINSTAESYNAVGFYIHGFRKAFVQQNGDSTSVEEFRLLKENLETYNSPIPLQVEVYWDGMYDCCFSMKQKKNKQLYRMFEASGKHAVYAGLGFRRVLNLIKTDSIQIIAHSLGSKVAHSALFNYYESEIATPQQKSIRVVYLAPALDASDFPELYAKRMASQIENYHFLIVYNEKDFVLRKKDPKLGVFGPGVKNYGCTSLGCNRRNKTVAMQKQLMVDFPSSDIQLLDKTSLGKMHSLRYYASGTNLSKVSEFLNNKNQKSKR